MTTFAIIPAAGQSRRMGRPKLLLPWAGSTLIEHVIGAWSASCVDHRVVVVAPGDEPLADVCRRSPCVVVVPDAPPPDMKASVCRGLEFIQDRYSPKPQDAWLVAPADLPQLSAPFIDAVIAGYDPQRGSIVVPRHGSRQGHPILFPWRMAADAFALADSESLKDLIARNPVFELEFPEAAVLEDLDTPQDYSRLQNRHNR